MIETNRRSLITGLASLIVAPAIVKVQNIMPVKAFDPYYTRAFWDYDVYWDSMNLRIDKSLSPLPMPKWAVQATMAEVYKLIPKSEIDRLKPAEGKTVNISLRTNYRHYHDGIYVFPIIAP